MGNAPARPQLSQPLNVETPPCAPMRASTIGPASNAGAGFRQPPAPPGYQGRLAAGYVYSLGCCYPAHYAARVV